jgi:hypothetical protein
MKGPFWDAWNLVLGLINVYEGLRAAIEGAPHGRAWAGAFNLLVGLLLLWMWWQGGGKGLYRRARAWLGAKSAALRATLARRLAGAPA